MKFRIKYADQVVGLFILLALLAFATTLVLLGMNQRWFAKDYRFVSNFPSGTGIPAGTAIQLKGFTVGKIDEIRLNDENTVDVKFHVFDTYISKMREHSVLELVTSPIGLGSQLLLHPGNSTTIAKENSFVPNLGSDLAKEWAESGLVEVPVKDDTITRLMSNLNPLLENTNKLIVDVNRTTTELNKALKGDTSGPVGRILASADKSIGSLTGTMATANATMQDVRERLPLVMSDVQALLGSVTAITENLEGTTAAFKDPTGIIPRLIDPKGSLKTFLDDNNALFRKVDTMLSDVERTLKNFQLMSDSLRAEVPKLSSILDEGKFTLQKAQDVMEGLKNNPLLKGGIPERKEQEASLQSVRDEEF